MIGVGAVRPLVVRLTLALSMLATCAALFGPQARAQDDLIRLDVSEGRTIQLPASAASVFVADPSIADVQTPSAETLFVFGKRPGRTTLTAIDADGDTLLSARLAVTAAIGDVDAAIRDRVGDYGFTVAAVPAGLILTGTVPSPEVAERIVGIAQTFVADGERVENRMQVAGQVQVKLKVRVAEVSRDLSKELGFNWDALGDTGNFAFGLATGRSAVTGASNVVRARGGAGALFGAFSDGSSDVSAVIDALASDNLVSVLAEPSLTALTGERASFLAGGEFPIPVAGEDGAVTVEYRSFGVSLDFVPLVVSGDQISLQVRPEVSELSTQGAIEVEGFSIPSVRTRRASTTVDLGSGQSFAIAGLLQKSFSSTIEKFPGLGDVPVLGALFRSSEFARSETELLIIVTPYVVKPVPRVAEQVLPTDLVVPPSDVERILFGRLTGAGGERARWHGPAGFIVE